jgi:hypothetical protein
MSTEEHVASPFSHNFSQDLENARVLIEEPPWKDNPQKYRKVAEGILKRILSMDPENQSAKLLLSKAEAPLPVAKVEAPLRLIKTETPVRETPPRPDTSLDLSFVVPSSDPPRENGHKEEKRQKVDPRHKADRFGKQDSRPPRLLVGFAAIGAIAGVVLLVMHWNTFTSQYPPKVTIVPPVVAQASAATRGEAQARERAASIGEAQARERAASINVATASVTSSAAVPAPQVSPSVVPGPVVTAQAAPPVQAPPAPQAVGALHEQTVGVLYERPGRSQTTPTVDPAITVVKSTVPPVAPIQTGTLAVSSPTTVDIYQGNQLVGSAPTTLVLPVGNQTLEYRHQDQRKVLTHVIKANETATTMVTFEVPVHINARPWAQVFIDGPQRHPLGQTPLSDVRVPIGSSLIFENPNFPGKTYRVTGKETEIRVTFP